MKWQHPPIIKIYEALGSIADDRIEFHGNTAKVYSSTRNKYYDVSFDPLTRFIMANDNGSFWKGYLGYPSIAFLMKAGLISYDPSVGELLKDIAWKDINQKFKNDFDKTLKYILSTKTDYERVLLAEFVKKVDEEIKRLDLKMLGKKNTPPDDY